MNTRKINRHHAISATLLLILTLLICSCSKTKPEKIPPASEPVAEATAAPDAMSDAASSEKANDIIILYTNDVHCGIDDHIGYAGLVDYKNRVLEQTPYVALVDCGDAVSGDLMGSVSHGEYIVDLMNDAGYDYAIFGNHEFDYTLERLPELIDQAQYDYLACNITYTGSGKDVLENVKPYAIKEFGDKSIAFIGVSTPYSIRSSTPKYFMDENGKIVYDFCLNSPEEFYGKVQTCVNECRDKGVDYVVVLSHLGNAERFAPFASDDLIANTEGIDVVLDGHAHNVVSCNIELNKNGEDVLLSSTGTKLASIGQLIITADGFITTGLISAYSGEDEDMLAAIDTIKTGYEKEMNQVVASSNTILNIFDNDGIRIVRSRETAIGNFCADAYRSVSGADIAFVNGGGIRNDLPSGDITYADVLAVHPFGNKLCMVEATGQEVIDALEFASRFTQAVHVKDGSAVGESGGFLQVSGLKYTIDTSIEPRITTDENGLFISVDGAYRVKDVVVMDKNGNYSPIDPAGTYTVASHQYLIKNNGDGQTVFEDNTLLIDEGMEDYQMLITYLTDTLNGNLEAYENTEGRITVLP